MIHNKFNLQIGDIVILDGKYEVKIIQLTPQQLFATIEDPYTSVSWDCMTNRLSPKLNESIITNQTTENETI